MFFDLTSCCILLTTSIFLCGPSAAALTPSQFCPRIRRKRNHFLQISQGVTRFGASFTSSAFLFLPAFIHSHHKKTYDELFALLLLLFSSFFSSSSSSSPSPFFFLLLLSFSTSSSLPSTFSELSTFPPDGFCFQKYLGPFTGGFLQRSLGPYPGCFLFFGVRIWGRHTWGRSDFKKRASKKSLLYFSAMCGSPRIYGWLLVGMAKRSRLTALQDGRSARATQACAPRRKKKLCAPACAHIVRVVCPHPKAFKKWRSAPQAASCWEK